VYFINVGAGDAILVDCGDWEALLDAGLGTARTNSEVLATLASHVDDGIIELAILSHPHSDHYGGFSVVFEQFKVEEFWRSYDINPDKCGDEYSTFTRGLALEGLVPRLLTRGDQIPCQQATWSVLSPGELRTTSKNDNENSLVLLLTYGNILFLFLGDIEDQGEQALQRLTPPQGDLVLKVAHHGSHTSTSLRFLEWADPELAIISTAHERPPATVNLKLMTIPFCSTADAGTICVSTDGERIWISSETSSGQITPKAACEGDSTESRGHADIVISYIHYDGVVPRTESDEYVEITNEGTVPQDLEDWRLVDISEGYPEFRFPAFVLEPGRSIRVYTNEIHPEWGGFSFKSGRAVWNNSDSDVAVLYNNAREEVSRRSY